MTQDISVGKSEAEQRQNVKREIDPNNPNKVELKNVAPGIDLVVNRDELDKGFEYAFSIQTTPELPNTTLEDYQTEGEAKYSSRGTLKSFQTNKFFGVNTNELLDKIGEEIDWNQGAMVLAATKGEQLVSEKFSPEAAKSIMEAWARATIKASQEAEEPNIKFIRTRKKGIWRVSLLPSDENSGLTKGLITEPQDLGELPEDSARVLIVRWKGPDPLKYRVGTGEQRKVPIFGFYTFMEHEVIISGFGFDKVTNTRLITVPQKANAKLLSDLFKPNRMTYQSIGQWFPVTVQKPL